MTARGPGEDVRRRPKNGEQNPSIRPWLVLVGFAVLFLTTASHAEAPSLDPEANALTAHLLAKRGTVFMPEYSGIVSGPRSPGQITWFVESPNGPVSQYPPGSALLSVPLYLLADSGLNAHLELAEYVPGLEETLLLPDIWPSSATAALATAIAVAAMYASLRTIGWSDRGALISVTIFSLGTAVWTVAADSLWQHGPGLMMVSLGLLFGLERRPIPSLVIAAGTVLVRPPLLLISLALIVGLYHQYGDRRLAAASLSGSVVGVGLLIAYNRFVYEEWSISGGYGDGFTSSVVSPDLAGFAANLYGALFSPERGVAVWSPFVMLAVLGLPLVWERIETWMRWVLLGACVYLVVQYLANRYSGGFGFSYYRYPLEPMFVLIPVGAVALNRLAGSGLLVTRVLFKVSVAWSVLVHAIAAIGIR